MKLNKVKSLIGIAVGIAVTLALVSWMNGHKAQAGYPYSNNQITKNISVTEAWELIRTNQGRPDFVILDVRTPDEFRRGRIQGAINLDFYSPSFYTDLSNLSPDQVYLVYCRTGRRSQAAVDAMKQLGFKEVYNVAGGLVDWWIGAGAASKPWPSLRRRPELFSLL